jgi:hypothetical protein
MAWSLLGIAPAAAATPLKVVIIVGPTGSLTQNYRETGNDIARAAAAANADVVKVYSPRATWSRVRNAVAGANVVVYLGHGNGYPNPYSSGTEYTDRANGWGLNRTTKGGDSDNWSTKMVYCGEKALLGTLTASDGAAQWSYCGGKNGTDGIHPAANWVMIYNKACYAPGASEGWDTKATQSVALQHVRNYSYPALKAGAGAYFATDMYQGGEQLVDLVLRHRDWTFGAIAESANGYELAAQRRFDHPDLSGRQIWLQRTKLGMETDYWLAYAGRPSLTPSGAEGVYVPPPPPAVTGVRPARNATNVGSTATVTATFDQRVTGVSASSFKVVDLYGLTVPGSVTYAAATRTARFTPSVQMDAAMVYKASLSSAIRGALGRRLAAYSWRFTIGGELAPTTTRYSPATELVLGAGTNTGYKFTLTGAMISAKDATLAGGATVTTTLRRTIRHQAGAWFYVASGTWKGYWVRASDAATLPEGGTASTQQAQTFNPARQVAIRRGTHTGYTFSPEGLMTGSKTATVGYRTATTTELSAWPGQTGWWYHVTSGKWTGYWLRASDVVWLLPES